jgi:hypothetical protein
MFVVLIFHKLSSVYGCLQLAACCGWMNVKALRHLQHVYDSLVTYKLDNLLHCKLYAGFS